MDIDLRVFWVSPAALREVLKECIRTGRLELPGMWQKVLSGGLEEGYSYALRDVHVSELRGKSDLDWLAFGR